MPSRPSGLTITTSTPVRWMYTSQSCASTSRMTPPSRSSISTAKATSSLLPKWKKTPEPRGVEITTIFNTFTTLTRLFSQISGTGFPVSDIFIKFAMKTTKKNGYLTTSWKNLHSPWPRPPSCSRSLWEQKTAWPTTPTQPTPRQSSMPGAGTSPPSRTIWLW